MANIKTEIEENFRVKDETAQSKAKLDVSFNTENPKYVCFKFSIKKIAIFIVMIVIVISIASVSVNKNSPVQNQTIIETADCYADKQAAKILEKKSNLEIPQFENEQKYIEQDERTLGQRTQEHEFIQVPGSTSKRYFLRKSNVNEDRQQGENVVAQKQQNLLDKMKENPEYVIVDNPDFYVLHGGDWLKILNPPNRLSLTENDYCKIVAQLGTKDKDGKFACEAGCKTPLILYKKANVYDGRWRMTCFNKNNM